MDVYLIPTAGGAVTRLTIHSADDTVLDWTPDGKGILFASQRGEDFMGKLYVVPTEGGVPTGRRARYGCHRLLFAGWQQTGRHPQVAGILAQVLSRRLSERPHDHGPGLQDVQRCGPVRGNGLVAPLEPGWVHLFRQRSRGKGSDQRLASREEGSQPEQITNFTSGDVRFPGMSGDGKTIVFEHDFGIWKLDIASRTVRPIPLEIVAETQQTLTEFRDFDSTVDDYDLAPDGKQIVFSVHGELFTAHRPADEGGELRQLTEGASRDLDVHYSPDGKSIAFISDQTGREEIHVIAADGAGPRGASPTSTA